jgi:phosphomannomutase
LALKVSVSGIRGIVGEDLTPEVILHYVAAFLASLESPKGTVLIGRDTRNSGSLIEKIVEATANALGWDCLEAGIVPTPTALLATRRLNCQGGIVITASHNPAQWNALKFCDSRGLFIREEQVERMNHLVSSRVAFDWKEYRMLGRNTAKEDAAELHIAEVMKFLDRDRIGKAGLRVAVDPCGATGSITDRDFLESLGCQVVAVHEELSSDFPRGSEPVPENLTRLATLVRESKAHVGFAQDPDADRLAVVSDRGIPIGEEYTLVLAGESFLRRIKTDIAVNLSTSMMVDDLAERHGVSVIRTKIGEINVTDTLLNRNLSFGGEGNGGVIVPHINPCRDSIVAMGLILELLAGTERTISDIIEDFPSYCMIKDKISYAGSDMDGMYSKLYEAFSQHFQGYAIDRVDGLKIYNREEWLHVRISNTEPAVRLIAESGDSGHTKKLIEIGKECISGL